MPGPFAHFTLFQKARETFCEQELFPNIQQALGDFSDFGLLGSNSPDFPILAMEPVWEEYLHAQTAAAYIAPAISIIPTLPKKARQKCTAWFCGYLSHMVGDATIHPVVNLRVGPYLGHEEKHQTCEVHQDAHVYTRLGLVELTRCNYTRAIIEACCSNESRTCLNDELLGFWKSLSNSAFPNEDAPDFNKWFAAYTGVVDKFAEENDWWHIRTLAKVGRKKHLLQIAPDKIDQSFILALPTPTGTPISYDDLFDMAIENTVSAWHSFAAALESPDSLSFPLSAQWNLNTGEIVEPKYLYWPVAK